METSVNFCIHTFNWNVGRLGLKHVRINCAKIVKSFAIKFS